MTILTPKQKKVLRDTLRSPHRFNVSVGAVRSGKTYLDFFRIPYRLRNLKDGENAVLIGNTQATLERNVIAPMRKFWGDSLVGNVHAGKVRLFGKDCFIVGAEKIAGGEKLRGMSIGYAYGDEITTWNENVFRMLESRLDKENSVFDGTCNPSSPSHWFKKFLDSDADIYRADFSIDDNPALPEKFVRSLKREYLGTVYYDRFILGKWRSADGIIYRTFADHPNDFILKNIPEKDIIMADIGVDFGGNDSAHAFNLTGYTRSYAKIITLSEYYNKKIISPSELERDFRDFVIASKKKFPALRDVYCDSAEQVLIRGLKNSAAKNRLGVEIHNAAKKKISDRICFYTGIMSAGRYFISENCIHTIDAFSEAQYCDDGTRRDNGSSNIDSLDAQEYSTEKRMNEIIEAGLM